MDGVVDHSVVQYIGISTRHSSVSCGYCKTSETSAEEVELSSGDDDSNEKKSVCLGLNAIRVFTEHINRLIDRGWNWSGRYIYKPIMDKTCCPLYTIRLDALNFKLSRSQRRTLRTWNEFLKWDKRKPVRGDFQNNDHQEKLTQHTKRKQNGPTPPVPEKNRERKKKVIRRNRALKRMQEKGVDIVKHQQERELKQASRKRSLESYFWPVTSDFQHKLEIRKIRVGSMEFKTSVDESFAVYEKYQKIVHKDSRCSRRGYQSFLVDNPFIPSDASPTDGLSCQGSYHIQYLIDDRIVAVGVVDLLPRCLSSAYFYYDPDYAFLNLGIYSALREIEFVRQIAQVRSECHYYYMGYYVHECRKMRYKGRFSPSELLCEHSNEWVPLVECIDMIEKNNGEFTIFRPLAPPAPEGNVWDCKPLKYRVGVGVSANFEKLTMTDELAADLKLFAKYFGPSNSQVYIVV